jgi:hypothetical protein
VGTTEIEKRIKVGTKFEVAHELGVELAPAVLGGFRARLVEVRLLYAKSFVNRLHLVLYACVETFDVTVFFCVYGIYGVEIKQGLCEPA